MMAFEGPWLSYPMLPAPTLLASVHPGETMPVRIARNSTAKSKHNYTMSRELHCDSLLLSVALPSTAASVDPGYSEVTSYINEIPRFVPDAYGKPMPMPSGTCFLTGMSEIQGFVRNSIQVYWYSAPFRVVAE